MSSLNLLRLAGRVVLAGVFLTAASGCTSLTQSDEYKINKDEPKSLLADPTPAAAPVEAKPAIDAVQKARGAAPPGANARPRKKAGSG